MRPIIVRCAFNSVHMWSVYFYNSSSMASKCAFVCKICINVCVSVYISLHISISSEVVLHPSSTAHIYAKPGSCQSVAPVTRGSTSPIKPDRAGLGAGRARGDLPACQSRARHPLGCLLSDPIYVCQTERDARGSGGRERSDQN